MNDSGMFELNFRDERYLPFEGTGAVSYWELSMPRATNRFDFSRLSDVIIHLSYTALDAGSGDFTSAVQSALPSYIGAYYLNLKQTFPGAWHSLLSVQTNPKAQSLEFPVSSEIIPPHLTKTKVKLTELHFKMDVTDNLDLSVFGPFLSLTIGSASLAPLTLTLAKDGTATVPISPSGISLKDFAKTWVISVDLTKLATQSASTVLINGFLDPAKVRNMECILLYEGDIAWNE